MKFIIHAFDLNYSHPALQAHEPARFVPMRLRVEKTVYNILFFFGLFFLVPGIFMFVMFFSMSDFASFAFGKDVQNTDAKIISVSPSNYSENETRVMEYSYVYSVKGKEYRNKSYSKKSDLREGDFTQIEYEKQSPSFSRIKNMRMAPALVWGLFFLAIFPLIGLGSIIWVVHALFNAILFIRHGIVVESIITDRVLISSKDSDISDTSDVYVEFETKAGKKIKTKINIDASLKGRVGQHATVVYLPWDPYEAVFLRAMWQEARAIMGQ